jgi:SAM-dependent methyltransferase
MTRLLPCSTLARVRERLTAELVRLPNVERVVAADLVEYEEPTAHVDRITCDLNEPLDLPDASFDAVAAIGVLEYLENPYAVAREWFRLLRPGGLVVLTVPNPESLRSMLGFVARGRPVAVPDSLHGSSHGFSRADLRRILGRAGFEPPTITGSGLGLLPRMRHGTWQSLSRGTLAGLRFSDDLVCSSIRP